MKKKPRAKGTGRSSDEFVEATRRKARRKAARKSKKKHQNLRHQRDDDETKKKREREGEQQQFDVKKQVQFSSVVEEKLIPSFKNRDPSGLKESKEQSNTDKTNSQDDDDSQNEYINDLSDDEKSAAAFRKEYRSSEDGATTHHIPEDDPYATLDEETALAFRGDDTEIAQLEEKLGLSMSSKSKKKLNKEFSRSFQGYGEDEDFGDFLDDLDALSERVGTGSRDKDTCSSGESGGSSETSAGEHSNEEELESEDEETEVVADHDEALTYRPSAGEDIYGKKIEVPGETAQPVRYIPPHLRKKLAESSSETTEEPAPSSASKMAADPETIRLIQRSLNNALNRLSEQTLESVAKSISSLYSNYPFHDLNDCIWKNIQAVCVPSHMIMSRLIPLYIGAMAGVHWLRGDSIQLGGCLAEWSVTKLYVSLESGRQSRDTEENAETINKEASNLLLVTCYLYNYGVVHCTLIYDLVRNFISNFTEIDVEALLLILSHCGGQLRSDDPSALKEIVLLVKDRAQNDRADATNKADSSRIKFMVDSIIELKNNKPRKQDAVIREKTSGLKKFVGRIKSNASQTLLGKKSGSCLRMSLQDVLDAEKKGRWWISGAFWAGDQHHEEKLWGGEGPAADGLTDGDPIGRDSADSAKETDGRDNILALASSQRMNTDARRSIFCIIMGSSDCDDAFEKLVRAGTLKPKAERDVVRVIVHCCAEEEAYNPFYSHLAVRVCEYQQKSRFTLMLTFWDHFKQLRAYSVRKAANLAKLLGHLMDKCLTVGVLKRIDFSPSDMSEMVVVFLSVFMDTLFESNEVETVDKIFAPLQDESSGVAAKKRKRRDYDSSDSEDDRNVRTTKKEDLSELRENLSIFLLQYVKKSPKNVEASRFHANLKAAIDVCEET